MKLSTRGRYSMRMMLELGRNYTKNKNKVMDLKKIANNQKLSLKYIEHIAASLKKSGLVKSTRGYAGGYALARSPERISALEILESTEKISKFCPCSTMKIPCPFFKICGVCDLWSGMKKVIVNYLKKLNLTQIIKQCDKRIRMGELS